MNFQFWGNRERDEATLARVERHAQAVAKATRQQGQLSKTQHGFVPMLGKSSVAAVATDQSVGFGPLQPGQNRSFEASVLPALPPMGAALVLTGMLQASGGHAKPASRSRRSGPLNSSLAQMWLAADARRSQQRSVGGPRPSVRMSHQHGLRHASVRCWHLLPQGKLVTDLRDAPQAMRAFAWPCRNHPELSKTQWIELADGLRPLCHRLQPQQFASAVQYVAQFLPSHRTGALGALEAILSMRASKQGGLRALLQTLKQLPPHQHVSFAALVQSGLGSDGHRRSDYVALLQAMACAAPMIMNHPAIANRLRVVPSVGQIVCAAAQAAVARGNRQPIELGQIVHLLLQQGMPLVPQMSFGQWVVLATMLQAWPAASRPHRLQEWLQQRAAQRRDQPLTAATAQMALRSRRLYESAAASDNAMNDWLREANDHDLRRLLATVPFYSSLQLSAPLLRLDLWLQNSWVSSAAQLRSDGLTRRAAARTALGLIAQTFVSAPKTISYSKLRGLRAHPGQMPLALVLALVLRNIESFADPSEQRLMRDALAQALARCLEPRPAQGQTYTLISSVGAIANLLIVLHGRGLKLRGEREALVPRGRDLAAELCAAFARGLGERRPSKEQTHAFWRKGIAHAEQVLADQPFMTHVVQIAAFKHWFGLSFEAAGWDWPLANS